MSAANLAYIVARVGACVVVYLKTVCGYLPGLAKSFILSPVSACRLFKRALMRTFRLLFSRNGWHEIGDGFKQLTFRKLAAQVISVVLIISILTTSTPAAAPMLLYISANEFSQDIRYAYLNNSPQVAAFGTSVVNSGAVSTILGNWQTGGIADIIGTLNPVFGLITGRHLLKKKQQAAPQRVVILPTNETNTLTILQGEKIDFTAIGLDAKDQPLGGVLFSWTQTDTMRNLAPRPFLNGTFEARTPGTFVVTADALGKQAQVNVTVIPNPTLGVQKLNRKPENARDAKEKGTLEELRQKGLLITRQISTRGRNREEDLKFAEMMKKKRQEVRAAQQEIRAKRPNPFAKPENPGQGNPNNSNNPRPRGPNAAEEPEDAKSSDETISEATQTEALSAGKTNRTASTSSAASSARRRPIDEPYWDETNYGEATDPGNWIGNTPGSAPAVGAGNGNFSLAAPVISLPGRGIDVNLSLVYNSRLWSRSGSYMSYDADRGNPAPGWNLGFGKIINLYGAGCMMVDPDGSRRPHNGSSSTYSYGGYYSNSYTGYATDGSFTDYSCYYSSGPYGSGFSGTARLANGTVIEYNSASGSRGEAFPTRITDANGNYITITYIGNQGPNIQYITDTLGRTITFNWDPAGRLVSVTGPAQNGGQRVLVRLLYRQINLSYAFNGLYADVPTNTPSVLSAIYYPEVNTGYWFGDNDSYSSYGMIAKVVNMRGMSWAGSSNNEQGSVTPGQVSRQQIYNFPMGPDGSLTDAPRYTAQTESWDGMTTAPAVTNYAVANTATEEIITVTAPNGTKSVQTSYNNPGAWNDGLYFKNETLSPANAVLGKSQIYMHEGEYNSFRTHRVETTDEKNQTSAVEYGYSNYNRVAEERHFNYANQLYRRTSRTYETSQAYLNRHIFYLPKIEETFDAGGTRLTRTDYQYDNNAVANGTQNHGLMATPGVVMYNYWSDPYTNQTMPGNCTYGEFNYPGFCTYDGEYVWVYQGGWYEDRCVYQCYQFEELSAYDPNTIFRGNVTKVTTYTDAQNLQGAIAYDYTYDVTGNQRTATTDCCQQLSFDYAQTFQYAYPHSMTKGSSDPNSPHRMTQGMWYDFNTGLQTSATDFNGRITWFGYDAIGRLTQTVFPTGGKRRFGYNDNANIIGEAFQDVNDAYASYSETFLNGRGQVKMSRTFVRNTSNFWDGTNFTYTDIIYDQMGRKTQVSVPYPAGNPSQWTNYQYDALSRVVQVTAPDGSVSQTMYNEVQRPDSATSLPGNTVRSRDAWGRERWARTDDFGRVAEVVEPNPNGNGSVFDAGSLQTSYTYDPLDQLTQVNQGAQVRRFRYDSLGRLTHQKLAEQNNSLNDAGQFAGANNGNWSDVFVYDNRSNLIQRTDARGVKTNYNYTLGGAPDPLNRLWNVSYDKSGAGNAAAIGDASPLEMQYMTSGDKTRVHKVNAWWTSEENVYDIEGRVSEYKITLPNNQSEPLVTSYQYDTLSRVVEVRYPQQFGMPGAPRKIVTPSYDETSRLKELRVDNQIQMSEIVYNPMSQVTQLKTGAATGNADIEQYSYDNQTGLLTNQKVIKQNSNQTLLDQSYEYQRGNSNGTANGKTGQLTRIVNNLDHNKNRLYEFDALGRLKTAKGGQGAGVGTPTANWSQVYTYDRYGNRTNVQASGVTANSQNVPTDGLPNQSYEQTNNRITTAGYEYDLAGNEMVKF